MSRLDQHDAYLLEFDAHVVAARADGDHAWVRLDASAFYPTSGGQLHDVGTLAGLAVDDVRIEDDGAVWHHVAGAADAWVAGRPVHGAIDGERRARHRQRHSAQHLLSQAFVRVDPAYATRSVALTGADLTVDLAGEPDDDAIAAAEWLANEAAYDAWPVVAVEVDEAELERFPLRRPPKVQGRIRLVAMGAAVDRDPAGAWELSACGGTHVRCTAEVAPIVVLKRERIRAGLTRVTFRAGWEALAHHRATHAAASAAAASLSTAVADLPAKVAALADEATAARRALAEARGRLAADLADELLGEPTEAAPTDASVPVAPETPPHEGALIVAELEPGDADLVAPLADALAARGATAVLAVVRGDKAEVVAASGAGVDVRPALQAALAVLGGRGGGKPARAQGAGPDVDAVADALSAAHDVLHGG
jgi:alanyl-tRNA synthetase